MSTIVVDSISSTMYSLLPNYSLDIVALVVFASPLFLIYYIVIVVVFFSPVHIHASHVDVLVTHLQGPIVIDSASKYILVRASLTSKGLHTIPRGTGYVRSLVCALTAKWPTVP